MKSYIQRYSNYFATEKEFISIFKRINFLLKQIKKSKHLYLFLEQKLGKENDNFLVNFNSWNFYHLVGFHYIDEMLKILNKNRIYTHNHTSFYKLNYYLSQINKFQLRWKSIEVWAYQNWDILAKNKLFSRYKDARTFLSSLSQRFRIILKLLEQCFLTKENSLILFEKPNSVECENFLMVLDLNKFSFGLKHIITKEKDFIKTVFVPKTIKKVNSTYNNFVILKNNTQKTWQF